MDKKRLALIHIVKKELNLSDEEYRHILQKVTGVKSAKFLDEDKFKKLMKYLVRSSHYRINPFGFTIKQKLYIQSLAQQLRWDKKHLANFIHKYYHTYDINKLTKKEAMKLIESLKNIKEHT